MRWSGDGAVLERAHSAGMGAVLIRRRDRSGLPSHESSRPPLQQLRPRVVNRSRTFCVLEDNRDYRARDICIRPRSRANLTICRFGDRLINVYIMPGKTRRQKRNWVRRFTSDGIIGRRL